MPIGSRAGLVPAASYGDKASGSVFTIGAPYMAPLFCLAVIIFLGINLWTRN